MPAWRGALCTVYAATMDVPGDTYIGPHGRLELHGWPSAARRSSAAEDPALARRLWEVSEKLSGVDVPALTVSRRSTDSNVISVFGVPSSGAASPA